jgi:hypothetical protein
MEKCRVESDKLKMCKRVDFYSLALSLTKEGGTPSFPDPLFVRPETAASKAGMQTIGWARHIYSI